jgi:hypothetical protein
MVRTRAAIGPWACLGSFCRSAPGYAAQSAPAKISEIARSGPLVGIRDHQPHPSQPPPHQLPQELRPELVGLAGPYVEPQDFPGPVLTYPNGYHRRHVYHPAVVAHPHRLRVQPHIRILPLQRPTPKPLHRCRSGRPRSGCSPPAPGLGPSRLPSGCSPPPRTPPAPRSPAPAPPAGGAPAGSGSSSLAAAWESAGGSAPPGSPQRRSRYPFRYVLRSGVRSYRFAMDGPQARGLVDPAGRLRATGLAFQGFVRKHFPSPRP